MKALVYRGPGKKQLEEMPKPALREAADAIVRMTKMTICGTDLHILKGDLPTVAVGRILGHVGIGVIEEVGRLKPKQLITPHFTLNEILKAYDTFGNAGREHALKVILTSK